MLKLLEAEYDMKKNESAMPVLQDEPIRVNATRLSANKMGSKTIPSKPFTCRTSKRNLITAEHASKNEPNTTTVPSESKFHTDLIKRRNSSILKNEEASYPCGAISDRPKLDVTKKHYVMQALGDLGSPTNVAVTPKITAEKSNGFEEGVEAMLKTCDSMETGYGRLLDHPKLIRAKEGRNDAKTYATSPVTNNLATPKTAKTTQKKKQERRAGHKEESATHARRPMQVSPI